MNKQLDERMSKTKSIIQLTLMGILVVVITQLKNVNIPSMLGMVAIILIGQFPHELLHSLASKIIIKDWGKVYFGLKKGFFYTDKHLNTKQFIFITSAPFVVMNTILIILYSVFGRFIFNCQVDIIMLVIGVSMACVSDLANIINQIIYSKQNDTIILFNPYSKEEK